MTFVPTGRIAREAKLKMVDEVTNVLRIKLSVHFLNPSKQSRHDVDEAWSEFDEMIDALINSRRSLRAANG
jgi:hypothetical protein